MRGTPFVAVMVLVCAGTVSMVEAQPVARDAVMMPPAIVTEGPAWGTANLSKLTLSPWEFVPADSGVTYVFSVASPTRLIRTNASGSVWMEAPFHLPTGALITQVEVQFCDSSATSGLWAYLFRGEIPTGINYETLLVSTSVAETPGCPIQTATLAEPMTVDNNANFYQIDVALGSGTPGDAGIGIGTVRIAYMLQISPAPASATFGDVPTGYWAFRHIEALAASGITVGCGGGNFCPENYVKRSEMAVYLAKALGLHWPDQTITAPSR